MGINYLHHFQHLRNFNNSGLGNFELEFDRSDQASNCLLPIQLTNYSGKVRVLNRGKKKPNLFSKRFSN